MLANAKPASSSTLPGQAVWQVGKMGEMRKTGQGEKERERERGRGGERTSMAHAVVVRWYDAAGDRTVFVVQPGRLNTVNTMWLTDRLVEARDGDYAGGTSAFDTCTPATIVRAHRKRYVWGPL